MSSISFVGKDSILFINESRKEKNIRRRYQRDCTARSHCARWKTQKRDVIGQRAIRRVSCASSTVWHVQKGRGDEG